MHSSKAFITLLLTSKVDQTRHIPSHPNAVLNFLSHTLQYSNKHIKGPVSGIFKPYKVGSTASMLTLTHFFVVLMSNQS